MEGERLAEPRLGALEEAMDIELACGRHAAVLDELLALTAEHPYRERLHGRLMLALYRTGRQGAVLFAAAEAAREAAGVIRPPDEEEWAGAVEAALREALGEAAYAAALVEGRRITVAEAVALGEGVLPAGLTAARPR